MKVVHRRCAGLDVHKETVVASSRIIRKGRVEQETRTFGTTTRSLMELRDWLEARECKHVVMEATGVYWKPVWHVLADGFDLVLANAAHVKAVPGRKTDVKDAEWLSELLAHGLVRGSFVPPPPIRELRDLTRTRKQLSREIVQHTQRIHKVLEDANIKVTAVLSDILGVTGRRILDALIAGIDDPEKLADLRSSRVKASREAFVEALYGRVTDHHRFLLGLHLRQIESVREAIADVERQIGDVIQPFRDREELLITVPGIDHTTAQIVLAEIGFDMSQFPSASHLRSWSGPCPRNDESAGKRRSTRLRKGGTWLKTALVQAAWAAVKKPDSYYKAMYWRLKARRGPKKAIVAVAASMLTACYYILRESASYHDLGPAHFDRLRKQVSLKRMLRRIQALGYQVTLEPAA
jgi:transposase